MRLALLPRLRLSRFLLWYFLSLKLCHKFTNSNRPSDLVGHGCPPSILASIKTFLKLLFHPYFYPFVEIYLEPLVGLDVLVRVFPLLTDHRFLNKQSVAVWYRPFIGSSVPLHPLVTGRNSLIRLSIWWSNKLCSCNTETRGRFFRSIKPLLPTIDLVRNCWSSINVISLSSEISILANQLANIVTDLIIAFALFMIKIIVSKWNSKMLSWLGFRDPIYRVEKFLFWPWP